MSSDHAEADQSFQSINDSLYRQGSTDGLPVVPPTEERVEEMLRGTDRPRDAVLGRLGNREGRLTVEKLATNAVMAGCRPPHMPVLEAGARALADPASNAIQFSVSTGSWAYQWLVNGPVRKALDIQSGTGAFGPGFRANRAIGRALGLAYKNIARIHPGEKDMGVMGSPFKYSLLAGENEEASPWEPYHVTHGFDADDSTITLAGPNSFIQWTPYRSDAEHVLEGMILQTPPFMCGADFDVDAKKTILFALCPYNAAELDEAGLDKRDVKEYLVENSYVPAEHYARGIVQHKQLARKNEGEPVPRRQLSQFGDPEYLKLVTIGGSGRFNATIGNAIGGPVTKRIEFPDGWESLVEEYAVERDWVPEGGFYG
ncbi:MAG: hypothetical protein ABEJ92_04500 [Halobacteriales archaeon]